MRLRAGRVLGLMVMVAPALIQAGCAGRPAQSLTRAEPVVIDPGCAAERAELLRADPSLTGPVPAGPALLTALNLLADDYDHLTQAAAGLRACRLDRAQNWRDAAATGNTPPDAALQALALEHRQFDREQADLMAAADRLARRQAELTQAADRQIGAAPASAQKIAQAIAAPPPLDPAWSVLQATTIRIRPDPGAPRIAEVRAHARLTGPAGVPAVAGWTAVAINDGSLGWVETAMLKPLAPNASAVRAAARAGALRAGAGDPVVAMAVAVRQTLPGKRRVLEAGLGAAAEAAVLAYERALAPPLAEANASPGSPATEVH